MATYVVALLGLQTYDSIHSLEIELDGLCVE